MALAPTSTARAWPAPTAVGLAGLSALAYLAGVDPERHRTFLPCPLHAATGLWCPGCGLTRATHRMLTGDVLGALGVNLLTPVVLGLVVWIWAAWWWPALTGRTLRSPARLPRATVLGLLVVAVAFGVMRNVPIAPLRALAP